MGFKARNKLIVRKRECSTRVGRSKAGGALQGWEGVKLETVVEWCVSGAKDLRFIGREFHKQGEELQNDRSPNFSLVETGGRERHR